MRVRREAIPQNSGFGLGSTKNENDICDIARHLSSPHFCAGGGQDQDQHAGGRGALHHAFGAEKRIPKVGRLRRGTGYNLRSGGKRRS